jgi:hypothetical protein
VDDYAHAAVPLAPLPGNASALISSVMAESPSGNTPTSPALTGALSFAAEHATRNPTHRVIAVLATDGLPTECIDPSVQSEAEAVAIAASAASKALATTPSIPTYIIGVFGDQDLTSMVNLDRLAVAGGTKQAFLVDASRDVAAQLLDALASIRSGSPSCEYTLPKAPEGAELDFNAVNVQLTRPGQQAQTLLYVATRSQCSRASLGWYYDADPAQGETPSKISVCPTTCDKLRAATGASVEIRLGCATLGPS